MDLTKTDNLFLCFMSYSIMGWIYETAYCSLRAGQFVNRGFLIGPYCIIYGFGALFLILFLRKRENPIELFIFGSAITCTMEYISSYLLERMFNARWWDYSDKLLNINGRVCLLGAVAFGTFSVLLIKVIHPIVSSRIEFAPKSIKRIAVSVLLIVFVTDICFTLNGLAELSNTSADTVRILG